MADYNKIYEFMTEYAGFLRETEKKEQEKLGALLSNDVKHIEKIMNEYQFIITKIESYEQKRTALFESENLGNMTLREAVAQFSGEENKNLRIIHAEINSLVENIKQFNKKSLEIANLNLNIMAELNLQGNNVSDAECYDRNGIRNSGTKNNFLLSKSI